MWGNERPALLIAGTTVQNVTCSLDKLTVVGNWRNHCVERSKDGEYVITGFEHLPDILQMTFAKFPYRYNALTASGCVIQFADKDSNVMACRVSWNPSDPLQSATAEHMLTLLRDKRYTRIDTALDYQVDLSGYIMTTARTRKTCTYAGANGKLQTLYLGSRESGSMYRIYDKALESGLPGTLWRIEEEKKFLVDEMWQFHLPFSDLFVVNPNPENLSPVDYCCLVGLRNHPEMWGKLPTRQLKKYRGMLKDAEKMTRLDPWPSETYLSLAQPLVDRLTYIMEL